MNNFKDRIQLKKHKKKKPEALLRPSNDIKERRSQSNSKIFNSSLRKRFETDISEVDS